MFTTKFTPTPMVQTKVNAFKKIFVAIDAATDITPQIESLIISVVDSFTVISITEDYSIPYNTFKEILKETKNFPVEDREKLSENIYNVVEKHFDNMGDEIHDLVIAEFSKEKTSWEANKIVPTMFIRDHKQDNKFRNHFSLYFPRIIQFLVDENNTTNPGEERSSKILGMNVDHVILITNSEENNECGIQYIGYMSGDKQRTVIMDGVVSTKCVFEKPSSEEKMMIFEMIDMDSEKYKSKFRDSVKKLRKSYYDSLKNQNEMKIIDASCVGATVGTKAKIPSKAMRKKAMKKKASAAFVNDLCEPEILEESYD
jgi:hypothetical protein